MPDRKKVGDVDPAGKKAFDTEMANAGKPVTKPAAPAKPAVPAKLAAVAGAAKTGTRRVREILGELADALDPAEARELKRGIEGKTVDQVVDEAITGVDPNKPNLDY